MDTPTSGLASIGLFFKEIIANPAPVGAAAPSGPVLGMRMATQVPDLEEDSMWLSLGQGQVQSRRSCSKEALTGSSWFLSSDRRLCPAICVTSFHLLKSSRGTPPNLNNFS